VLYSPKSLHKMKTRRWSLVISYPRLPNTLWEGIRTLKTYRSNTKPQEVLGRLGLLKEISWNLHFGDLELLDRKKKITGVFYWWRLPTSSRNWKVSNAKKHHDVWYGNVLVVTWNQKTRSTSSVHTSCLCFGGEKKTEPQSPRISRETRLLLKHKPDGAQCSSQLSQGWTIIFHTKCGANEDAGWAVARKRLVNQRMEVAQDLQTSLWNYDRVWPKLVWWC